MKKEPPGAVATARTPENVGKSERGHCEESNRSARRHAVELGMGESTVWRILHKMACNNVSFRDNK